MDVCSKRPCNIQDGAFAQLIVIETVIEKL